MNNPANERAAANICWLYDWFVRDSGYLLTHLKHEEALKRFNEVMRAAETSIMQYTKDVGKDWLVSIMYAARFLHKQGIVLEYSNLLEIAHGD